MDKLKRIIPLSVMDTVKNCQIIIRKSTAKFRSLPHFLIIGAMKSGTSSLFYYLSQHRQIIPSIKKEVHYFDAHYYHGIGWYQAHFPSKQKISLNNITGEATPSYLFHPHAARRIHALLPNIKMIVLLRNPTDRAISHYYHEVKYNRETLPIMEALQAEEGRIGLKWEELKRYDTVDNWSLAHIAYKKRGMYLEQLSRFYSHFNEKQLLVLSSEQFFSRPHQTLFQIFDFLGVEKRSKIANLQKKNVTNARKNVPANVYSYLNDFFSEYNQQLFQKIKQDFQW